MYLLLDYGDFIDGSVNNTANPYVQILSTTDPAEAHADFVATRLGGKDTTGSQHISSGSGSNSGFFHKYRIPIFAAAAVAGVAALAGVVWLVAKRRKAAVYRPLYDPAPVGDMPMQNVTGYSAGTPYSDPWTNRR